MSKQELCQVLYKELKGIYNILETNNIANYLFHDLRKKTLLSLPIEDFVTTAYYQEKIKRLIDQEPIQYILNQSCFMGIDFYVDSSVLIPRPETEELVSWVLNDFLTNSYKKVLDIGTGSGCIPILLGMARKNWEIEAVDISEKAIVVANKNAIQHKIKIKLMQLNFLQSSELLANTYDILISNPPYIASSNTENVSEAVFKYEPHIALFTENDDPLIFYKEIAKFGKDHLSSDGCIYLEMNEYYSNEIQQIFRNFRYSKLELRNDLQGKERMLKVQP